MNLEEKETMKRIGETIRIRRKFKFKTQKDVSENTGLSQTYLSQIESGNKNVTILTLKKIFDFLDADFMIIISNKKLK